MSFPENLEFMRKRKHANQEEFAVTVGIGRSTISKLENGRQAPTARQINILTRYFDIVDPSFWGLSHEEFKERLGLVPKETNLALLKFRTTSKNLKRAAEVQQRYKGTYSLYYEGLAASNGMRRFICSILTIQEATPEGIGVSIVNPYDGRLSYDDDLTAFRYRGYLFPLERFLYILAEQEEGRYEVLSLVFHESSAPRVNSLRGMISGVGVAADERAYIAARPALALLRNKKEAPLRSLLVKECRYWLEDELPDQIKRELAGGGVTI